MKTIGNVFNNRILQITLALTLFVSFAQSTQARNWWWWKPKAQNNIVETLEQNGNFTTLLAALEAAELKDTVADGGPFTLFAPTDEAFAALPAGTVEALLEDIPALTRILLYHVVSEKQNSWELVRTSTPATLQGDALVVLREGWKVTVNGQAVSRADWRASNGIIHVVGGVLIPPDEPVTINSVVDVLALDGRFNTLIAAVGAAGLGDTLVNGGPFTLFAPTDEAFAALPPGTVDALLGDIPTLTDILLYHVLGSRESAYSLLRQRSATTLQGADVDVSFRHWQLRVNDSRVLSYNVNTPNAVVHIINAVLLPPEPEPSILVTLQEDGRFGTLLAALEAAGLSETVDTGGPFTLFAPTDEAFEALPPGTVEGLLADTEALTAVLLYHVVSGEYSAKKLYKKRRVETLEGSKVQIRHWRGTFRVNNSRIIDRDVTASNGRIQVIDQVLIP